MLAIASWPNGWTPNWLKFFEGTHGVIKIIEFFFTILRATPGTAKNMV